MSIDSADFRRALGQFATGITVVTTVDGQGRPYGLTVNAFSSVSLDPPLVLFCLNAGSEASAGLDGSGLFGVSILSEQHEHWSRHFARSGVDRFSGVELETGLHGLPLIPGALAWLECRVRAAHPAGDHTIYVGEVLRLEVRPGRPLLYHGSAYRRLDGGGPDPER